MNHKLLIVALLALFVSSCAPKQTVQQEEPPVAAQPPEELKLPDISAIKDVPEEKKPEKPAEKKQEEQYVMLNFENADIETVIATISRHVKDQLYPCPGRYRQDHDTVTEQDTDQ